MKRLLMGVPIVALALAGFVPAAEATGYTTSGQQSGSEHCSGAQAALDTGAAVGVAEAGERDWYSVTSDEAVTIRWRPASAQIVTGISTVTVYEWNQNPGPGESECRFIQRRSNFPLDGGQPLPIVGCCLPVALVELGPFPPGQYQVAVHAWNSQVPAQAYVLTSTPA